MESKNSESWPCEWNCSRIGGKKRNPPASCTIPIERSKHGGATEPSCLVSTGQDDGGSMIVWGIFHSDLNHESMTVFYLFLYELVACQSSQESLGIILGIACMLCKVVPHSFRVPASILSCDRSVHGILDISLASALYQNMPIGGLVILNCPFVWMSVHVCVWCSAYHLVCIPAHHTTIDVKVPVSLGYR